jgi:hypothetical protein
MDFLRDCEPLFVLVSMMKVERKWILLRAESTPMLGLVVVDPLFALTIDFFYGLMFQFLTYYIFGFGGHPPGSPRPVAIEPSFQ